MSIECEGLGKRIRELREKAGITQPKLAEIAGVSSVHMSKVETGIALPGVKERIGLVNIGARPEKFQGLMNSSRCQQAQGDRKYVILYVRSGFAHEGCI